MKPITKLLMLLFFFLLPWQTRWIFGQVELGGGFFEYGALSFYASEIVLLLMLLLQVKIKVRRYAVYAVAAAAALLLAAGVSTLVSADRLLSAFALIHLAEALALFVILLSPHWKLTYVLHCFVIGLVPPAVLGWMQVVGQEVIANKWLGLAVHLPADLGASVIEFGGERFLRAYGTFPHPNMLGGFMAAGLIIVLFLWLRDKSLFTKWLLLGMTILFSGTLVITFSRGAWLSLVISLVVFLFFFLISRAKKLTRKSLGLIGLMLITCAMTAMLFWNPFTTRFHPAERLEAQSLVERQDQYHEFGQLFRSSPIFGVGPGAYAVALEDQYPGDEPWRYQPVHNAILLVLAELGFVGGILFFVLVQILDLRNYKAWNSLEGVFGMSLGTALLIPALLDHYVWSSWSGLILSAFVLAMIYQAAENGLSKGKIELK